MKSVRFSGIVFLLPVVVAFASRARGEMPLLEIVDVGAVVDVPVSAAFTPAEGMDVKLLAVVEQGSCEHQPIPAQYVDGRLWWLLAPGDRGTRSFRVVSTDKPVESPFDWEIASDEENCTLREGDLPVLEYHFKSVPMPPDRKPNQFADGRPYGGPRSNYLHPLYGFRGEVLTEDYPEHPHHRGLWWSWPVVRWGDRVADLWAVCDVWARPEKLECVEVGPVMARFKAVNVWKFGVDEQHPIVRETLVVRVFPSVVNVANEGKGRLIDVDVTLVALEDDIAIGGRPKGGYGGMTLRAIPAEGQEIAPWVDDESAQPRRAWCQYSADFSDDGKRTALILFQHADNPAYPSQHNVYTHLNCFMPAFPGETEYSLPRGEPVRLKHRAWIREGAASREELERNWDVYHTD